MYVPCNVARVRVRLAPELTFVLALLASLDNYERAKVADALESVDFEDGEYIIRQGEEGHSFFILEQV